VRGAGRLGFLITARAKDREEVDAVFLADNQFPDVVKVVFARLSTFIIFGPFAILVVTDAARGFGGGLIARIILCRDLIHDDGAPLVVPGIRRRNDVHEEILVILAWPVEALGLAGHGVLELINY
jgi:hypothetical protein